MKAGAPSGAGVFVLLETLQIFYLMGEREGEREERERGDKQTHKHTYVLIFAKRN